MGLDSGLGRLPAQPGLSLNSYRLRPRSRGSVLLRSADPRSSPMIDLNAFADPNDLDRTIDGVAMSREILSQPAFRPFINREHAPGERAMTRADLSAFARQHFRSACHTVGTCRMGRGLDAVVDPMLRVRGIEALRVCDSSIMPRLISSNTNAATIMIAEKAADLIG